MGLFKTMKTNAKRMMGGAWGRAILIMLIVALPVVLINLLEQGVRGVVGMPAFVDGTGMAGVALDDTANVAALSSLIAVLMGIFVFIVVAPLQYGMLRWYYRRTSGEQEGIFELFHYFETARDYFRALGGSFLVGLKVLLWSLLFVIPTAAAAVLFSMLIPAASEDFLAPLGAAILLIWAVLAVILLELIALRYFLVPYLLAGDPALNARQAIKQSVKLTRGHKGSLLLFELSFILWYIPLVIMVVMVTAAAFWGPLALYSAAGGILLMLLVQFGLAFYLQPYLNASFAVYARYLAEAGESGGGENATREYAAYKPEIDRYLEEQATGNPTRETPIPPEAADDGDAQG